MKSGMWFMYMNLVLYNEKQYTLINKQKTLT